MTLIKIKRNSIKRNPNAGRTDYLIAGKEEHTSNPDGSESWHRDVQHVRSLFPEPKWLFEYQNNRVTCNNCGKTFGWKRLESDYLSDFGSSSICPYCKEWDCCEIEFEDIKEVLRENSRRV